MCVIKHGKEDSILKVALIPMGVKVNDFEATLTFYFFPSTALRALKSGTLAERSFMVKSSIESANLRKRTRFM